MRPVHLVPPLALLLAAPVLAGAPAPAPADAPAADAPAAAVTIDTADRSHATFDPRDALGAGVDGATLGEADRLLTPHNIAAMRSAGLTALTYRLRTELGIEAWHWNPRGTWSDPVHHQGYWTSSDKPGVPIRVSFGYNLPRRGDTIDNANNTDYSRLTDGDEASFWKSNPYLDPARLHDGRPHWQWLVLRLDAPAPLDTVRLSWADPYALDYEVQYWTGNDEYTKGAHWVTFPHGMVTQGHGGVALLRLSDQPITARFIRVVMKASSHTALPGAVDWRDHAGFAMREVGVGTMDSTGHFTDLVHHLAAHDGQTFTHVSSTDPWHRAVDRDTTVEQPGLDRMYASGLTNGRPMLVPVGVLFDNPDNAAAELRYLRARHVPLRQVELGEEPDGQYGEAEDYGALYLTFVDALKPFARGIALGGPSAQDAFTDTWMIDTPDHSWNSHFIAYLKSRNRLSDLGFYSTEHYPFDDICGDIHARLIQQNHQLQAAFARLAAEGVPRTIPWIISEYGFSAYSGRAMADMPSALLMANIVGQFLDQGGATAYMFGYGPNVPINQHQACAGYGNMMLFMADAKGQATTPMPSYETARLLTHGWLMPAGPHRILASTVSGIPGEWVKSYAVARPDGRIGLLLLNRDPAHGHALRLPSPARAGQMLRYGPAQYAWADEGPASHPSRSLPPARSTLAAGTQSITLPPDSLTVILR
jgi:hypothetical protein